MESAAEGRWAQISRLYASLDDAPESERARVLAEVAATDPELADTVRGMLAHSTGGTRLRDVVEGVAASMAEPAPSMPARFGAYRTVREIGRGGMGVVYEGVSDDEFRRRVAIKVAPLARIGAAADARFRLERQILSSLEHPHIARFLDAGADDGLPYLVMEFVEGESITSYVTRRALPLADRLRLVQKLCAALQFAHQRLIVHRDLKPSNILVTDDGTPKLLDFGVAKLLDTGAAPAVTLGATAWTPDYASPEQVTGDLVGTPSDIYSLGLVLYEVLTGERAQVADTTSPLALSRSVCEQAPAAPSERLTAAGDAALARRVRGDLDTIVMAAIHKDPARRYASASALADDLERFLTGLPIDARPSTLWYRVRKGAARHRVAVVAAALVVMAVTAGLVSTAYQARRADRRFQQVRALANEFVFGVHDRIETLPGSTEARRALVQTALTYLENLREDADDDPGLARELAAAYQKIGRVQGHPLAANLGDQAAAITSFTRAIELMTPLDAAGDREASVLLARAELQVAGVVISQGDLTQALARFERARGIAEGVAQAQPTNRAALELLGEINGDMARAAGDQRDAELAAQASSRAVRAAEALVALDPTDPALRSKLASVQSTMAAAHLARGSFAEAAEAFGKAAEIREVLVREAPGDNELRRGLVVALGNKGDILGARSGENLGDYEGAVAAFDRVVAISREMVAADPKDRRAVFDLVNALLRLGATLTEMPSRTADAVAALEEADGLNATLMRDEPASERFGYLQAVLDRRLGRHYRLAGRFAEAERRLLLCRQRSERMFQGSTGLLAHVQHALCGVELASLFTDQQDRRAPRTAAGARVDLAAARMAPMLEAQTRADLARVFAALSGAGVEPAAMAAAARAEFDASEAVWRRANLPPPLHPQREKALAQIAGARSALDNSGRR